MFTIPATTLVVPPDLAPEVLAAVRGGLRSVPMSPRFVAWVLELEAAAGIDEVEREFMTVAVAAKLLGVTDRRVRAMAQERVLRAEKREGYWLIDADDLDRFISRRVPGGSRSIPQRGADSDMAV